MTDKEQIMIDGVDVSECFHYINNKEYTCRLNHTPFHYRHCEENPNCYFKQLARKTQECEELKSESFTREELITLQEKDIEHYRKVLEEIETCCKMQINLPCRTTESDILDIINKLKDEYND